jgi:hypothetical protein
MSPSAIATLFTQTYAYYLDRGGKDAHVRALWGELVRTLSRITKKLRTPAVALPTWTSSASSSTVAAPVDLVDLVVSVDMSTSLLILMKGLGCTNAHLIYGQLLPGTQTRELYSLVVVCSTFAVDHQSMVTVHKVIAQMPRVEPRSSIVFDSRWLTLLRFQVRKVSLQSTLLEKAQEESIRLLKAIFQVTVQDAVAEDVHARLPPPMAVVGTGLPAVGPESQIQEVRLRDATGVTGDECGSNEVPCVHNFLPRHVLELSMAMEAD